MRISLQTVLHARAEIASLHNIRDRQNAKKVTWHLHVSLTLMHDQCVVSAYAAHEQTQFKYDVASQYGVRRRAARDPVIRAGVRASLVSMLAPHAR